MPEEGIYPPWWDIIGKLYDDGFTTAEILAGDAEIVEEELEGTPYEDIEPEDVLEDFVIWYHALGDTPYRRFLISELSNGEFTE